MAKEVNLARLLNFEHSLFPERLVTFTLHFSSSLLRTGGQAAGGDWERTCFCSQRREGSGGVTLIAPHSLWLPQSFHGFRWVRKTRKATPLGKGNQWPAPYAQTAPSPASLLGPLPVLTHLPKVTLQEAGVWPYWKPPVLSLGSHRLADWLYLLFQDLVKGYILRWTKRT